MDVEICMDCIDNKNTLFTHELKGYPLTKANEFLASTIDS